MKIHTFFSSSAGPMDMKCSGCIHSRKCKSPQMSYSGKGEKKILIVVGEVDRNADISGTITEGRDYKFLNTELRKKGINLYKDCWVLPCIKCYIEGESKKVYMNNCNDLFRKDIQALQPEHIWTFGNTAMSSITDKYYSDMTSDCCHGDQIPIREYDTWLTPFYSIAALQASKKDPNFQAVFSRDLDKALLHVKKNPDLPQANYLDPHNVTFLLKYQDVISILKELRRTGGLQAVDLETTGLKPHRKGHKITTVGIATDDHAWSFPLDYQTYWNEEDWEDISDAFVEYLEDENVELVAHNKNFENLWTQTLLQSKRFFTHCTMATQHIIDHRPKTKSLKYQVFRRWGLYGWEKSAQAYIEAPDSNSLNRMDAMPLAEQLLYVGLDPFVTMKLYREQQNELIGRLPEANAFWQTSVNTMSELQCAGIHMDKEYYEKTEQELTATIHGLEKAIQENEEVRTFTQRKRRAFNDTSPDDLRELLFKQMRLTHEKATAKGSQAVDASVLQDLDVPVTNYILQLRKYLKLRDTYLAQFKREVVDGYMYPFFNLMIPVTYRSSSSQPNFQNTPKRDKESKILVRSGIIPRPGNLLCEIDFSGMEVSTSATYHKDPVFINYLLSETADMHRDNGCDIWMLPGDEITKEIRFFIKNGWTFPQFYGDWYQSCGKALWKSSIDLCITSGISLKEHLHDQGIHCENEFIEHCKTAEDIMWNKRFKVYSQWKKDINEFYLKHGYVETHLGFRFTDYMDRKQVANYPVQGTAFHLLLTCLNMLSEEKKKRKWKSKFIGQVHDSGIIDLVPEEKDEILSEFKHIAAVKFPKMFSFIGKIPFRVDGEISEINGNFAKLTEYEIK